MKHIITCLAIAFCSPAIAQQSILKGTVSWPDGTPFTFPAVAHLDVKSSNGTFQETFEQPIVNGQILPGTFLTINPLLTYDVTVTITAEVDARYRVTVLDLLRIRNHLLNVNPFTTQLQNFAADVNNSVSISAIDLVEIQKMILGVYATWPRKDVMTFFERTQQDPPPVGAVLNSKVTFKIGGPYPAFETRHFWAVKTGDVQ